MRNFIYYVIILVSFCFACSTKSLPSPGIPNWDYERDVLGYSSAKIGDDNTNLGAILGGIMGSMTGGAIGGMVRSGIQLNPAYLFYVFETALSGPPVLGAIPHLTTGRSANFDSTSAHRWEISESNEGQIITDWEPIEGKTVGLLWWKKQYQTEVCHTITINISHRSQKYSNFSIDTQVRERPNSKYDWVKGNSELGRESFREIKKVLLNALKKVAGR